MTAPSRIIRESICVDCSRSNAHRYLIEHFARRTAEALPILIRVPLADLALDREIVVRLSDLPSNVIDHVMHVSWSAKGGGPYPTFFGSLTCLPVTATSSRIEVEGIYTIPGGIAGQAFDAVVGRRIALTAAHSLLERLQSVVEAARDFERSHMLLNAPKGYAPSCD